MYYNTHMLDATHTKKPAPRPRKTLVVDLGDLKESWLEWCAAQGVTPSQAMREIVMKVTVSAAPKAPLRATELRGKRDKTRVRREIRLSGSEDDLARKHAKTAGFSVSRWLLALVRAQLTGNPQLGQEEQEALAQSNYQLLMIGRNLNQIARALNTTPEDRRVYNVEAIEQLREYIQHHVVRASAVIEANLERWKLR